MIHPVYPFYTVRFFYPFAFCSTWKQVVSPPQFPRMQHSLTVWDMTVSTFLESWIPRSNSSSFLSSLPSFLPPSCLLLCFHGLHHSSASWPPLLGPFNHIWHSHTHIYTHLSVSKPQTHMNVDTHTNPLWAECTLVSPHTGFVASVGILWLVWAEDSGGFPSCPPKTLLPSFSLSVYLFLFSRFLFSSSLPCPPLPASPIRPQGQKYPVV